MNDVPIQGAPGYFLLALVVLLGIWAAPLAARPAAAIPVSEARPSTNAAMRSSNAWEGPATGPRAQPGKTISLVIEDLGNGGVLVFAQGVREAAREIGWTAKLFGGKRIGLRGALAEALASRHDGLILGRLDALENRAALAPFGARAVPMIGWHVHGHRRIGDRPHLAINEIGYRDAYRHIWRGK